MNTLAIDARPLGRGEGGIQRYLKCVLPYIIASNEFTCILYSDKPITGLSQEELACVEIRTLKDSPVSKIKWFLVVPFWLIKDKATIFWSPRHHLPLYLPKYCKSTVTIHDFVYKRAPKTMPFLQLVSDLILTPLSIRKADLIICISNTTKKQLLNFYPTHENKCKVIVHGRDDLSNIQFTQNKTESGYFIAVGTLEPRKNYARLIKCFYEYADIGGNLNLIIVGKNGWHYEQIYHQWKKSIHSKRISILTDVTDQKLHGLYHQAASFISISLDEGYGLPAQEAIDHGLPLLLSNLEVYRELYPFADVWVDPTRDSEITDALTRLEKFKKLNSKPKTINIRTWQNCSNDLMDCFIQL